MRSTILPLLALFAAVPVAVEHAKTDIVTTNDGSTLYTVRFCSFKTPHLKTDVAGTLDIEWRKVTSITSKFEYQV